MRIVYGGEVEEDKNAQLGGGKGEKRYLFTTIDMWACTGRKWLHMDKRCRTAGGILAGTRRAARHTGGTLQYLGGGCMAGWEWGWRDL